jgi:hypothetical protein
MTLAVLSTCPHKAGDTERVSKGSLVQNGSVKSGLVPVSDISSRQQEECARLQHVNNTSLPSLCVLEPCRKLFWGSASDRTAALDGFWRHDALQGSTTACS